MSRRRVLAGVPVGLSAGLPTTDEFPFPPPKDDDGEGGGGPSSGGGDTGVTWTTETTAEGAVTITDGSLDGGELSFSVVQCNSATADGEIGTVDTTLDISFDYEVDAEMWYEDRVFSVLVDDEVVFDESDDADVAISANSYSVTTGSVDTSVPVDGETVIRFGLAPSQYCSNADHAETALTVSNLQVDSV